MIWNWQNKKWPCFTYDKNTLEKFEDEFLYLSGTLAGSIKFFSENDSQSLVAEIMSNEACFSSEIEGEILNRDSVLSSIRKNFGLKADQKKSSPAEKGMADFMVNLYKQFDQKLSHKTLFHWHKLLLLHQTNLCDIGVYRTHKDSMQVISGQIDRPKIHFEAPPSKQVKKEMDCFLKWYNETSQDKSPLIKSGLTHLYFVSIHPFEDGNGRIARALALKAILEFFNKPVLLLLSETIQKNKKEYYRQLERNNKSLEITEWLMYFCKQILIAQREIQKRIDFLIHKTKFIDRYKGRWNERQGKVILRIFREGAEGFKGGLSAENYIRITKTSRATATRDLNDLVTKGIFKKTGHLKGTRYDLNLDSRLKGVSENQSIFSKISTSIRS